VLKRLGKWEAATLIGPIASNPAAVLLFRLLNRFNNLVEIRPVAGLEFGMEQFAIGANFEGAAARRNQRKRLDTLAEFKNFGRQTDGLRRVVSNDAVFDRDFGFHRNKLLSAAKLSIWLEWVKSVAAAVPAAIPSQALDTSASTISKRSVPQPAPPGCGVSTSATAETAAVFSPEGVNPQDV